MEKNKQNKNSNSSYISHREDLADVIISKSLQVKQDVSQDVIYFFVAKPLGRLSTFLMLLIAFTIGFTNSSNKYQATQTVEQTSVIEEIYYSNSYIL